MVRKWFLASNSEVSASSDVLIMVLGDAKLRTQLLLAEEEIHRVEKERDDEWKAHQKTIDELQ
jgi:hypothetical protein